MRIILIEDERQLAQILKKGLEEAGYSVDTAYDGEEGLYMLENIPADAAVLDIMLPKMDGLTVLNRLRKKGIQTPVILLGNVNYFVSVRKGCWFPPFCFHR